MKVLSFLLIVTSSLQVMAQDKAVETWKKEVISSLNQKQKTAQEMVDMVFSFSELGFQEVETSAYLTGILEKNGFKIERGIGGIPTACLAKW